MIHFAEKILIAGHTSTEGLALERQLLRLGHPKSHILHAPAGDFDWCDRHQAERFLAEAQPDQLYLPASHFLPSETDDSVKRLLASTSLMSIITSAASVGIRKLLLIVGSEVYPSSRLPPFAEEDLLGGPISGPKTFNALCQIWAMKYCQEISSSAAVGHPFDYRCAVVGTTYGPGDDYCDTPRRLVPRLIKAIEHAKANALDTVNIALEEDAMIDLLFIDDMAEASVYLMEIQRSALDEHRNGTHHHINIAHGEPVRLKSLVQSLANILGYFGNVAYSQKDSPAAPSTKNLDPYRLALLGWTPMMEIDQGIEIMCTDYQIHRNNRLKSP